MKDVILVGRHDEMHEVPAETLRAHLAHAQQHPSERLAFMTPEHHLVRNFAVRELPRNQGRPLKPEDIAQRLHLPLATVKTLLDDLQRHLFFLVLNREGEVSWAFPVTVEETPHRLRFSSGETIFAACAEDALATPFVQGRLRNEHLTVDVETACAHCDRELHLTLDSELQWSVKEAGAQPLLFEADVDWKHFDKPNIIGDY